MVSLVHSTDTEIYTGSFNIEHCITDQDKFDRRKFGRPQWGCGHKFNPFYCKSYKEGEWRFNWVGCDHQQPEAKAEVNCPVCGVKHYFDIFIPQ